MHPKGIPDLKTRELASLVTLAEYGSFSAAAAALDISQPTLSRMIQRLERVLAVPLVARSTRRVQLTRSGRHLVAVAQRLLDDLELASHSSTEADQDARGQVIVSTNPSFASLVLPGILREFRATRPRVEIQVRQGLSRDLLEDVCTGIADFAIGYFESLPDVVDAVPLWRDPLRVVCRKDHPLASRKKVRLVDLRTVPFLAFPRVLMMQRMIDIAAAARGFELRPVVTVTTMMDAVSHLRAGVGCATILPGKLFQMMEDEFAVRPLTAPALWMNASLLQLRARNLPPAATSLIALALRSIRRDPRL